MSLNYEQKQRLDDWSKRANLNCPVCSGSAMKFGELIQGLPTAPIGSFAALSERYVQGTCFDCGHVMLFDRTIIGV